MTVIKRRYGQLDETLKVGTIIHFETDSSVVMIDGETGVTLDDKLAILQRSRKITLSGDVSGAVTYNGTDDVVINTTVADSSHAHVGSNVDVGTAHRVVISDGSKKLTVSNITSTELGYLDGVTANIQSQLNGKAASGHNHDSVYVKQTDVGASSGLVPLGADGKIAEQYLPSYVDDVIDGTLVNTTTFNNLSGGAVTPESGKIYNDVNTNLSYRWSGSAYVSLGSKLALGETASTAYRGDRGKIAYDHSQTAHARTDATKVEESGTNGNIKIDGVEINVYAHPSVSVSSGTASQTLASGGTFQAISAVTTNAQGHLTGKTTKTYTLPKIPNMQRSSAAPSNQAEGDLWFQPIS